MSLFAQDGVSFVAFGLDLDKARLAVEECALEGRLVGLNLEHLQVLLTESKFLAIIVMEDSVTKLAFT